MITFNYKIKIKINKTLIKAFIKTHKIFNENYIILNNFSNETEIDQNLIFLSVNMIIIKKTIFIIDVIFQITQLKIINFLLTLIKYL